MFGSYYGRSEESQPQVISAADGRALFLPRGRGGPAYEIPSHSNGYDLERRMNWVRHGFVAALIVVLAAAAFTQLWWILVLVVPIALLRQSIQTALLSSLRLAEDSMAVAAASAREGGNAALSLLAAAAGVAWYLWEIPSRHRNTAATLVASLIAVAFGMLELFRAAARWRAELERPLDVSGAPENKPIVPR